MAPQSPGIVRALLCIAARLQTRWAIHRFLLCGGRMAKSWNPAWAGPGGRGGWGGGWSRAEEEQAELSLQPSTPEKVGQALKKMHHWNGAVLQEEEKQAMKKSGKSVKSPGSIQLSRTSISPFPLSQGLLQESFQWTHSSGSGMSDRFVPWISIHSEIRQEHTFQKHR